MGGGGYTTKLGGGDLQKNYGLDNNVLFPSGPGLPPHLSWPGEPPPPPPPPSQLCEQLQMKLFPAPRSPLPGERAAEGVLRRAVTRPLLSPAGPY